MTANIRSGLNSGRSIHVGSLKLAVFDCDGVIFDSKEANVRFYNKILEMLDKPPVRQDQIETVHMLSARKSLEYLLEEEDGPQLETALRYCEKLDFRQFNDCLQCEPGLMSLLEGLKPTYKIALATNRTVSTREILEYFHLDHFFDLVVTASDVQFPKPHPESMERILHAFGVAPSETIYIGDSQVDEALASATDVFFAAYKNQNLKAHLHVSHFRELSDLLLRSG